MRDLFRLIGSALREGARADLLIARADTIDDLVAGGALERTVLVKGRIVASTSGSVNLHSDPSTGLG
jgi:hypothetical protein